MEFIENHLNLLKIMKLTGPDCMISVECSQTPASLHRQLSIHLIDFSLDRCRVFLLMQKVIQVHYNKKTCSKSNILITIVTHIAIINMNKKKILFYASIVCKMTKQKAFSNKRQ
jgi:hypothetical protein